MHLPPHNMSKKAFPKSKSGTRTPYTILDRARNGSGWANSNTQRILVQIQKSVLKWLFLWTSPSLFKSTFKHSSFSSEYLQTAEAYFKRWPCNSSGFCSLLSAHSSSDVFLQPEWKLCVITIPMDKRWERNNWDLLEINSALYIWTLQQRVCSRAHTDIVVLGRGCGEFSDSAWGKRRPVSLNKFTERYNSLLISLPKIVVAELPRSTPEVSAEWESHWICVHRGMRVVPLNEFVPLILGETPQETQFKARQQKNLCQHCHFFLGVRLGL